MVSLLPASICYFKVDGCRSNKLNVISSGIFPFLVQIISSKLELTKCEGKDLIKSDGISPLTDLDIHAILLALNKTETRNVSNKPLTSMQMAADMSHGVVKDSGLRGYYQNHAVVLDEKKTTTKSAAQNTLVPRIVTKSSNSNLIKPESISDMNLHAVLTDVTETKPVKFGKPNNITLVRLPPRKMADTSNPVYFLHVGKAGGTSIDSLVRHLLRDKKYIGGKHYDWSYIQKQQMEKMGKHLRGGNGGEEGFDVSSNADVITFLRHPVSRAVSQFYFSKGLSWAKKRNETFLHQTFDEYLDDPNKSWTQPIADGESGTDFLAGIFSTDRGCWVASDRKETQLKIYLRKNKTAACLFAARRLEETVWFGLMEDIGRSMILLQLTLGLEKTPVLQKTNAKRGKNPRPSNETVKKIEKYVPKDLWLYEYANRLFEARWDYFTRGNCTYVPPELPPLPDFK